MRFNWLRATCKAGAAIAVMMMVLRAVGAAQDSYAMARPDAIGLADAPVPAGAFEPAAFTSTTQKRPSRFGETGTSHRFWDRENTILFGASAAFSAGDFVVTRNNLRNGGQEYNPLTRVLSGSTAGLAANFAGETAGVVGLSYFFHRTGHHRLERAVSMLNIAGSATAVTFDSVHR